MSALTDVLNNSGNGVLAHDAKIELAQLSGAYEQTLQEIAQLRADVARLTQERDAAQAAANEARKLIDRTEQIMLDTGNRLDWPPEMPMDYAEMYNDLHAWIAAHPAQKEQSQ